MHDYTPYKKVIKDTRELDGLAVTINYAPTRALNQLQAYIEDGRLVGPSEVIKKEGDNCYVPAFGSLVYYEGIKSEFLADTETSASIIEDFMRLLALLTQDKMLNELIKSAPRKKDGHLLANRIIFSCTMDGVIDNLSLYSVKVKTAKNDTIDIDVTSTRMGAFEGFHGSTKEVLDTNKDLLASLGLID